MGDRAVSCLKGREETKAIKGMITKKGWELLYLDYATTEKRRCQVIPVNTMVLFSFTLLYMKTSFKLEGKESNNICILPIFKE